MIDQVTPQAVDGLVFFAGTREQVCQRLADYAGTGLIYGSIVDYNGRTNPARAGMPGKRGFLVTELQQH